MYLVVFSTNLDWGRIGNGVKRDSISRSFLDRGLKGVWPFEGLGHISSGSNLKTLLIALSKDQDFCSESGPESFDAWCTELLNSKLCDSSITPPGCTVVWTSTVWGEVCLDPWYGPYSLIESLKEEKRSLSPLLMRMFWLLWLPTSDRWRHRRRNRRGWGRWRRTVPSLCIFRFM